MPYKDKEKEWRNKHPEKIKEYSSRWVKNHPERVKYFKKRWNENNPDYYTQYYYDHIETIRASKRNWAKNHPSSWKKYQKSPKGRETKRKNQGKRQRTLGFKPLNQLFCNSNAHHLDKLNVVYIPTEIHKNIGHRQNNEESMTRINLIAWDFLETSVL